MIGRGKGRAIFAAALMSMAFLSLLGSGTAYGKEQTWQIRGKTLAELSLSEETFTSKGTFEMGMPFHFQVRCEETAQGKILGENKLEEKISFSGCTVPQHESCTFEPMETGWLSGTVESVFAAGKPLFILRTIGTVCAELGFAGETSITAPETGFHLLYGPNGAKLAVKTSATGAVGTQPFTFSGSSSWGLSGANAGYEFGQGLATFVADFGSEGSGNGQLLYAWGVAADASGNRWVADAGNNRIEEFNSKGEYLSKFGTEGAGNGQFSLPAGIAIAPNGHVWVADTQNNRIEEFNAKGEYLSKFGTEGTGNGQLSMPFNLAIDASGNVWVADTGNNRIEEFNAKGEYLAKFGTKGSGNGQLSGPFGVDRDASGNLWVADTGNNRIEEFNSKGEYLAKYGTKGSGKGQLNEPVGIAAGANGIVSVVDQFNNRVEEL